MPIDSLENIERRDHFNVLPSLLRANMGTPDEVFGYSVRNTIEAGNNLLLLVDDHKLAFVVA
jgi:hypothetical protein